MKAAVIISRVLLGLGFTVFGLNILFPFLPQPPMPTDTPVGQYVTIMAESHWMMVVGVFQLLGGLFVLSGRMAPLGLVFLAPILVNILCFHIFLTAWQGLGMGLFFSALELFLIYAYRNHFAGIFTCKATPSV